MTSIVDQHRDQVATLCQHYGVRRLELFRSAASSDFDPRRSDLDFLVDFGPSGDQDLFHRYFGLNEALEQLFGRKVDLVMVGALKNSYFIESVNKTRQLVYAAPVTQEELSKTLAA
jgi:predicted nucleotidyltransferase